MKKKILEIIVLIIAVVSLLPVSINRLKDGGSVEYKFLIYQITKYHKLNPLGSEEIYTTGFKIEIFGFTIYDKKN